MKLDCQKVLVAVGVQGNSDDLGLEELGIEAERSFIKIDERMQTSVPGVYAIGDVTGKLLLAHVASAQGVAAVETIAGLDPPELDYTLMPRAIYCEPQVASFGLTEAQATAQGIKVKVGKFPLAASGKALALAEHLGVNRVNWEAPPAWCLAGLLNPNAVRLDRANDAASAHERSEPRMPRKINFLRR